MNAPSDREVTALHDCLQLEYFAVWAYPYLAARVSSVKARAEQSFLDHRHARDELIAKLHDVDAGVPNPAFSYDIGAAKNTRQAEKIAQNIEANLAQAYAVLVAANEPGQRKLALKRLREAALADISWGAAPQPFPGLPD